MVKQTYDCRCTTGMCVQICLSSLVKFVHLGSDVHPWQEEECRSLPNSAKYHSTSHSLIQYEIGLYPNSRWTLLANSVKVFILLKYKNRTFRSLYLIILVIWFTTKLQLELFSDQYYISHHGFWPTPTSLLIIPHMKNPKVHVIIPMPLLLIRYEAQCVWDNAKEKSLKGQNHSPKKLMLWLDELIIECCNRCMDKWILNYHSSWQNYNLQLFDHTLVILSVIKTLQTKFCQYIPR